MQELLNSKKKERAKQMARIIQNIKICRKNKCQIKIGSFGTSSHELIDELSRKSFGATLGMSSLEIRDSIKF